MRLLPEALQVRGDPASLRAPGGRRRDAARAQAEARRSENSALAGARARDDDEPLRVVAARQRLRADAERLGEAIRDALGAGRVVDERPLVVVALRVSHPS